MNLPRIFAWITFLTAAVAIWLYVSSKSSPPPQSTPPVVRVLAWVGYHETDFTRLVEEQIGAELDVQVYASGPDMYNQFTNSADDAFDIVIVDVEYGRKLYAEGRIEALAYSDFSLDGYHPYFKDFRPAMATDAQHTFAIVARWGTVGLAYNTNIFSEPPSTYNVLWGGDVKGRVGLFDWYLPTMGALSLNLGNSNPYDIDDRDFEQLGEILNSLGPQIGSVQALPSEVIADLQSGASSVVPGVGEWAVASLVVDGQPLDWTIPKEGGVMFIEGMAIPSGLSPERRTLAMQFINAMTKTEIQAALAWRSAYQSQVANQAAYWLMSEPQRSALKASTPEELNQIIETLKPRELPRQQSEQEWQAEWDTMKALRLRK